MVNRGDLSLSGAAQAGAQMKVQSIQVLNYKSLRRTEELQLGETFTVVVGQNNAGKTALIERLGFASLQDKPYTTGLAGSYFVEDPTSETRFSYEISGSELDYLMKRAGGGARITLPVESTINSEPVAVAFYEHGIKAASSLRGEMVHRGGWRDPNAATRCANFQVTEDRKTIRFVGFVNAAGGIWTFLHTQAEKLSYVFKAERLGLDSSKLQNNIDLQPDASNLAGAILQLQGESRHLFEEFVSAVRRVLPLVKDVRVLAVGNDRVAIRVWNEDAAGDGFGQGRPLNDCGTGVGQVLAILFVVITARHGRLIVIDEPATFLHPSAVRVLLDVLKEHPKHQYVISTHAPEVISAVRPERLWLVRWEAGETKVEVRQGEDIEATKAALGDIGSKLSDVFGYDALIWVEGPTEERCFPMLLTKAERLGFGRLGFVPIINTGDLLKERKNPTLIWRIYERIAKQSVLLPQTLSFALDLEELTVGERQELVKASGGLVKFLPRRCIENYLLHPKAISQVMPAAGSDQDILMWLNSKSGDQRYRASKLWGGDLKALPWLVKVDAAKLLSDLFSDLTPTKEEYRKTLHSPLLMQWIIENDAQHLAELSGFVRSLLPKVES